MKKINAKSLYAGIAVLATVIASAVATSACLWFFYQPVEPRSIRK